MSQLEDLLKMLENKIDFKLVEVLSRQDCEKGHISGAINLSLNDIERLAGRNIKKTETVVAYCKSHSCQASAQAARKLLDMGYRRILDFKGSIAQNVRE